VISSEPTLPVATINQPEPVPGATPPMGRSRRLKQRLQELQAQYDVLSKNIARLRIDLANQAPGALRLQLERDIERAEEDRAGLEREIEGLERETTSR
jgi:hypothetical protein